jgi:hypothetical protein
MRYAVNYSSLTGTIYAGRIDKAGTAFTSKSDETMPALLAVADLVLEQHDGEVELNPKDGDGPAYRITVEKLDR